ncbi:MAG: hypothetical protein EHM14_04465 [Methanothrix sp.]|nr:MAG: hypothetical protein EHM14_04465 [Methanothrix sp.]
MAIGFSAALFSCSFRFRLRSWLAARGTGPSGLRISGPPGGPTCTHGWLHEGAGRMLPDSEAGVGCPSGFGQPAYVGRSVGSSR